MIKRGGTVGVLLALLLVLACLGSGCAKGSEDLLEYVNGFLKEEKENGRIDELADEYIYQYIEEEEDKAS